MRKMPGKIILLMLLAGLAAGPVLGKDARRKVYRWVDDQGVVHFGDSVPAEHASSDRQVLNKHGVAVETQEGQITPAEEQANALAAAEAERL